MQGYWRKPEATALVLFKAAQDRGISLQGIKSDAQGVTGTGHSPIDTRQRGSGKSKCGQLTTVDHGATPVGSSKREQRDMVPGATGPDCRPHPEDAPWGHYISENPGRDKRTDAMLAA